jgi:hypothetical protein
MTVVVVTAAVAIPTGWIERSGGGGRRIDLWLRSAPGTAACRPDIGLDRTPWLTGQC